MDKKGDDRDEEHARDETDISPAPVEEKRCPSVIGMSDDIGKTDHHGKDVQYPVSLIQAQREVNTKADVHHVTEDQIAVDLIRYVKKVLP